MESQKSAILESGEREGVDIDQVEFSRTPFAALQATEDEILRELKVASLRWVTSSTTRRLWWR